MEKVRPASRDTAVDMLEQVAAGSVAGDVMGSQQLREANSVRDFLLVLEGGRVVRDASNAGLVELLPRRAEQLVLGVAQQHKLAA